MKAVGLIFILALSIRPVAAEAIIPPETSASHRTRCDLLSPCPPKGLGGVPPRPPATLPLTVAWAQTVSGGIIASAKECNGPEVQNQDINIILHQSFDRKLIKENSPEGANGLEKAAWGVYRQLTGRDFYEPANYMFFRQAVKKIGFIPAIFATADRILRDSKIGTAGQRIDADHPVIKEGPEAYAPGKNGK